MWGSGVWHSNFSRCVTFIPRLRCSVFQFMSPTFAGVQTIFSQELQAQKINYNPAVWSSTSAHIIFVPSIIACFAALSWNPSRNETLCLLLVQEAIRTIQECNPKKEEKKRKQSQLSSDTNRNECVTEQKKFRIIDKYWNSVSWIPWGHKANKVLFTFAW